MHSTKLALPFNETEQYRTKLLNEVFDKTWHARSLIDSYKALCLCVLVDTMDDYTVPEFIQDVVLDNLYGDNYDGLAQNIIDDARDIAHELEGFEAFNDEGAYEHAVFKRGDFPTTDPDQLWIYYLPNVMFYEMGLCLSGHIPAAYDSNEPHVFDTYNKKYSNKVLETKLEIADYVIELLEPLTNAMMDFLKSRLDIQEQCEPHHFLQVIKEAKREGFDVSMSLRSDFLYSWFDRFWLDVLRDNKRIETQASKSEWAYDFPDDVILQ